MTEEKKDRFATERFENEPETDDVEGHRLKDDPEKELDRNADRNAGEPDVEAHRNMSTATSTGTSTVTSIATSTDAGRGQSGERGGASRPSHCLSRSSRARMSASAGLAPLPLEPVERGGEPRGGRYVRLGSLEDALGRPCAQQEVERDRGLVGEHSQQIHLPEAERRLAVEHLQHPERALLVQDGNGHQPLRNVARPLGHVARVPRVALDVLDHDRLPGRQHPAGDPLAGRHAHPEQLRGPPRARPPRPPARPSPRRAARSRSPWRRRSPARPGRSTGGARRTRSPTRRRRPPPRPGSGRHSSPPPTLVGGQIEHVLELERRQLGMRAEHQRADTRDVRRGEAVARDPQLAAVEPRDVDPDAAGEELDRRLGVVVVGERIGALRGSPRR